MAKMWMSVSVPEMWMSTFMLMFFYSFWKPPRIGEVLPKISTYSLCFLFCRAGAVGGDREHLDDLMYT